MFKKRYQQLNKIDNFLTFCLTLVSLEIEKMPVFDQIRLKIRFKIGCLNT